METFELEARAELIRDNNEFRVVVTDPTTKEILMSFELSTLAIGDLVSGYTVNVTMLVGKE